jgi:tetratricopeptide (TPR) repeat protein
MMVGDAAAARGHFEDALSLVLGEFGAGHPHEGTLLANYGGALSVLDEPGAAVVHLRRAATLMVAEYGPDHIRTASVWGNLAQALVGVGQTEEAIELYRQVTAVLVASFGDHHPQVATAYLNTAEAFRVADRPTEALEACEAADAALGTEPIGRVAAFVSICLGGALQELGRSPEAVAVLGPFARGEIQLEEPALHAELRYLYGVSLYDTGAKRDAVDWVRGSVAAIRAAQGLTEGELSAPERWLEQHDKTGPTKIAEPRG